MTTSFADYAHSLERLWAGRSTGLVVLKDVESTQVVARGWVRDHYQDNAKIPNFDLLAWSQDGGIGRRGKSWSSPAGVGVYASLVRRLPATLSRGGLQVLPLLISVALCEALNDLLDGRCGIRWPNDLWVDGQKIAGILIDLLHRGQDSHTVVIGFGVNHGADLEGLEVPGATSLLAEKDVPILLPEFAHRLVESVDASLAHWPVGESIVEEYRRFSLHSIGDEMRCRVGSDVVVGRLLGFDLNGFLRLSVDGDERRLAAGELELGSDST